MAVGLILTFLVNLIKSYGFRIRFMIRSSSLVCLGFFSSKLITSENSNHSDSTVAKDLSQYMIDFFVC